MQLLPAFNNHHHHHHLDLCDAEPYCHQPPMYFGPYQVTNLCSSNRSSSLPHVKTANATATWICVLVHIKLLCVAEAEAVAVAAVRLI